MHTVVETAAFLRSADAAGMTAAERRRTVDVVAATPTAGDLIIGSGGCRKLRVAGRGFGKSGGYRVITFYMDERWPAFLLWAFSKGRTANLTRAQVNDLAKVTRAIRDGLVAKPAQRE